MLPEPIVQRKKRGFRRAQRKEEEGGPGYNPLKKSRARCVKNIGLQHFLTRERWRERYCMRFMGERKRGLIRLIRRDLKLSPGITHEASIERKKKNGIECREKARRPHQMQGPGGPGIAARCCPKRGMLSRKERERMGYLGEGGLVVAWGGKDTETFCVILARKSDGNCHDP